MIKTKLYLMKKIYIYIIAMLFLSASIFLLVKYYDFVYQKGYQDCESVMNDRINEILFESEKKKIENRPKVSRLINLVNENRKFTMDSIYSSNFKERRSGDIFLYSLLISNKYNDPKASFNVFCILTELDSTNSSKREIPLLDGFDRSTQQLAIDYLKKASGKNSEGILNAKQILGYYYLEGKYIEKDTILGRKLINEAFKQSIGVLR